ncbi:MAG: hypothetical protein GY926_11290 [bacterium]|nr:hypothetical protein [bacterium]
MNDLTYGAIHAALVDAVPEFRPELEEHLSDHDGEVLPHLLFGDLTRFVLAARDRGDHALVERCLAFLESVVRSPRHRLLNLVAVSFVENVGPWQPGMASFIEGWPEELKRIATQQGWGSSLDGYVPSPPDIDVYIRLEGRDRAVIESFLDTYITSWRSDETWHDAEPVTDAFARAYADATCSFARYGEPTSPDISGVIIAFGRDGSTVLGLSIHGEFNPFAEERAMGLLDDLMNSYGGSEGAVVWEQPPPLDRDEWVGLDRLGAIVLEHRRT